MMTDDNDTRPTDRYFHALLGALLMITGGGTSMADEHGLYPGKPFTDPAKTIEMPAEWHRQPIRNNEVAPETDIIVTLDQHLYPALLPLIKQYVKQTGKKVSVSEGTCGISAGALSKKEADIGGFCCPPSEGDRLPGLKFHTLGIAAIALITHPDNPVDSVSLDEARHMFSGVQMSWLPTNAAVRPVARLHCKHRPGHWRLMLDNEDMFSPLLSEVSTIPDMVSRVSNLQHSIGYETLWMLKKHEQSQVKVLQLDGISPTDNNALASGGYPLYRTYNITSWSNPESSNADAEQLIAYLKDNFGAVNKQYGLLPAELLRQHGWKFYNDELVGEPDKQ